MNSSSSVLPERNFSASLSKSSNSRSMIGMRWPGTFSRTSGFASEPLLPCRDAVDVGSIGWKVPKPGRDSEDRPWPRGQLRSRTMDPHLDATAQAELVRSGEVSPRELVEGAIERIEALNPELNAVIHPLFETALETEAADGPFKDVPFVVKDLVCAVKDTPHHEGMRFLKDQDFHADADSWLASRFREAGFVFVGKTNTPEMGILPTTEPEAYGPSRNPWNTAHSPGGSSGGSGSAVASGMVSIGHANDGGGSIRIPASCNGLVGLKATRARVSMAPLGDFVGGLATELVV